MLDLHEPRSGARIVTICLPCVLRLNAADGNSLIRGGDLFRTRSRPTSSPLIHEPDAAGGYYEHVVNDVEAGQAEQNGYRWPEFHVAN